MKSIIKFCCAATLSLLACACGGRKQLIEHVVLIGVDCLSEEGLLDVETPTLDSLMSTGAYSFYSHGIIPTISLPNWSAMLCGAGPEATGVVDNSWTPATGEYFPMVSRNAQKVFPNIFNVLREQRPDAEIGAINHWAALNEIYGCDDLDYVADLSEDSEAIAKGAASYIIDKKPTLAFFYFEEVDEALHGYGHMSEQYQAAIRKTDACIKVIMNAIAKAGMKDNTLVMVVSDHGARLYAHGDNSYPEFNTPIIYNGPCVKRGYEIQQQIYRYDVAADIAFALGLKIPQIWTGRPVKAAFKGYDEPEYSGKDHQMLPPPVFLSDGVGAQFGELVVGETAKVRLRKVNGMRGEIHYTVDGSIPTADSPIYKDSLILTESAGVKARVIDGKDESVVVDAAYRLASPSKGNGMPYKLYFIPKCSQLPASFNAFSPVATSTCYEPSLKEASWEGLDRIKAAFPEDKYVGYSIDGYLKIDETGTYLFKSWYKGGYRVRLGGKVLFEQLDFSNSRAETSLDLKEGLYPIHIDFLAKVRSAYFDLYYTTPSSKDLVIIPAQQFFSQCAEK